MLTADIIPGVLSISSNRKVLKGFPICEDLSIAEGDSTRRSNLMARIAFEVEPSLRISNRREGKAFRLLDSGLVGMEIPLGRVANVTCAVSFSIDEARLLVNKTFFRAAKMTLGNVHSVGWLLRDLCNVQLLNHGFALVHGAALKTKTSCVLLIGLSNTGKTSTVKNLVSSGRAWTFGDDLFVTDGREAAACPYTNINVAPSEFATFGDRMLQRARRGIPFYEYVGPTTRTTLSSYLGHDAIAEPTKIDSILFLRRSSEFSITELSDLDAFKMLDASNAAEFTFPCNSLFRAYDFLTQSDKISGAINSEGRLLTELCRRTKNLLVNGGIEDFIAAARDALGMRGGDD